LLDLKVFHEIQHFKNTVPIGGGGAGEPPVPFAGTGLVLPRQSAHSRQAYYYVVEHSIDRDGVLERLAKRGTNCNLPYRWPIHIMRGCADLDYREGQFPVAGRKALRIFSLPYPHLTDDDVKPLRDGQSRQSIREDDPGAAVTLILGSLGHFEKR